jgi:hypothetical protein
LPPPSLFYIFTSKLKELRVSHRKRFSSFLSSLSFQKKENFNLHLPVEWGMSSGVVRGGTAAGGRVAVEWIIKIIIKKVSEWGASESEAGDAVEFARHTHKRSHWRKNYLSREENKFYNKFRSSSSSSEKRKAAFTLFDSIINHFRIKGTHTHTSSFAHSLTLLNKKWITIIELPTTVNAISTALTSLSW